MCRDASSSPSCSTSCSRTIGKFCFVDSLRWRKRCPVTRCVMFALQFWCWSKQSAVVHVTANPVTKGQKEGSQARWPLRARPLQAAVSDPQRALILLIWVSKVSQRPSHSNDGRKVDDLGVGGVFVDGDVLAVGVRNRSVEVSKGAGACATLRRARMTVPFPCLRAWANHRARIVCSMRLWRWSSGALHLIV
jgi:hypothetical protein